MNIQTIYLDMDGVISDFKKGCEEIDAIDGTKVDWPKIHELGPNFWAELPWTKDGEKLVKWLIKFCNDSKIDLCILSAVNYSDGVKGKQTWLDEKIPTLSKQNRYFVKFGRDKAKYANKTSLLIDDFGKNIEGFVMAGGEGIKYKTFEQCRDDLMSIV